MRKTSHKVSPAGESREQLCRLIFADYLFTHFCENGKMSRQSCSRDSPAERARDLPAVLLPRPIKAS